MNKLNRYIKLMPFRGEICYIICKLVENFFVIVL